MQWCSLLLINRSMISSSGSKIQRLCAASLLLLLTSAYGRRDPCKHIRAPRHNFTHTRTSTQTPLLCCVLVDEIFNFFLQQFLHRNKRQPGDRSALPNQPNRVVKRKKRPKTVQNKNVKILFLLPCLAFWVPLEIAFFLRFSCSVL